MTLLACVAVLLLIYGILLFNGLVSLKNRSNAAWSDIDVQLKRRSELVPNLVELVKGYASHEHETFERVAKARGNALRAIDVAEHGHADRELTEGVRKLLVLAEGYPELKASGNFLELQKQLIETEDLIQNARRYYNAVVRDLNTKIESFPDLIVARLLHFRQHEFFQLDTASESAAPILKV